MGCGVTSFALIHDRCRARGGKTKDFYDVILILDVKFREVFSFDVKAVLFPLYTLKDNALKISGVSHGLNKEI